LQTVTFFVAWAGLLRKKADKSRELRPIEFADPISQIFSVRFEPF
jgi:hypothetical protein